MGPLESFLGDDKENLTKARREEAEDRPTFFAHLEEDLNDWEGLDPAILHNKMVDLQGYKARVLMFGWQGEDRIETGHYKKLVDRLDALVVRAKGN